MEKEPGWKHAIITVASGNERAAAMQSLARCHISGVYLQCSEITATGDPAATLVAAAPPAGAAGLAGVRKRPAAEGAVGERAAKAPKARLVRPGF